MAWLEQHPTSGRHKICFRWGGRQYKKTVKTADRGEADAILKRVEENIGLAERGRLVVPLDGDVATFFVSDGKLGEKPKIEPPPKPLTLGELREKYLDALSHGAMEANSLQTVRMHLKHIVKTLGVDFVLQATEMDDLQRHINRRAQKMYRGKPLSTVTLRKEMASLRACWNWGRQAKKINVPFPNDGLKYPKVDEKPRFQTWHEIQRQIARSQLTEAEKQRLWDCVFLTLAEIEDLLTHVKQHSRLPFLYPMFVFAAHTGARRSEILRVRLDDLDLEGGTVLLREKKRIRGVRSTRRVPLSPFLATVVKEWLSDHPGGQHLFCQSMAVVRSKSKRTGPMPVTINEAQDHFRRTVAGSKWQVLRGWHVFRHSFCSNLAAAGVDQRLIDGWVGHTTEEMRRRYRHLIPNRERQVIQSVFGRANVTSTEIRNGAPMCDSDARAQASPEVMQESEK